MRTSTTPPDTCPRCHGRKVHHYLYGLPDLSSLVDADGNLPEWIHLAGCLIGPGPEFDRRCVGCGLRWTTSPWARVVVSNWRELRDLLGVTTDDEANEWLERRLLASASITPLPASDDGKAAVHLREGAAYRKLSFPFTFAELESTLVDLFEEASRPLDDRLEPDAGVVDQ